MLTRKQHQLLLFIDDHLRRTGFSPSFDEMKDALDLRSKSGIHRLISALEERGFLRRHHHRARALEVVRMPNQTGPAMSPTTAADPFVPTIIPGGRAVPVAAPRADAPATSLPLFGKIAAGLPIEALRDANTHVHVPTDMLSAGDHYALVVSGDSMIEAGILDGDIVIIRQDDVAETGQIVVALIDGQEVTLKRLRRRGSTIALEPANPNYETRIVPADRVQIQGRLVGLFRQY
jgi:repressor LexA